MSYRLRVLAPARPKEVRFGFRAGWVWVYPEDRDFVWVREARCATAFWTRKNAEASALRAVAKYPELLGRLAVRWVRDG